MCGHVFEVHNAKSYRHVTHMYVFGRKNTEWSDSSDNNRAMLNIHFFQKLVNISYHKTQWIFTFSGFLWTV